MLVYCLALDARFNDRGENVLATLERVCAAIGTPNVNWVDQGTEFVFRDMDLWADPRRSLSTSPAPDSRPTTLTSMRSLPGPGQIA